VSASRLKTLAASGTKGITVADFLKFIRIHNIPDDALVLSNLPVGKQYPSDYSELKTAWRLGFINEHLTDNDSLVVFDYQRFKEED
jgi:hypothetical protein